MSFPGVDADINWEEIQARREQHQRRIQNLAENIYAHLVANEKGEINPSLDTEAFLRRAARDSRWAAEVFYEEGYERLRTTSTR